MRGLANLDADYAWTDSGNGFLLRICHQQETLGLLAIEGISFPEYKEHYLNLALTIVDVCGLAIANARTYHQISQAEEALRRSEEFLQTVIDAAPDVTLVVDRNWQVVLANRAARERAGGKDPVASCLACHELFHQRESPCDGELGPCPLKRFSSIG